MPSGKTEINPVERTSVARQYVTFDSLYVEQPPGFDQIGVQSGKFTKVDQLNDTTLGWVFFDLRAQFEADLKKHDS